MARIRGISDEEASFFTRQVFRKAADPGGRVPDPLRLMAHSSPTMWSAGLFQTVFERAQRVEPKLKILACLRASSMIGCVF